MTGSVYTESRMRPILGHLAWLAERIEDPVNDGRLRDAALLTYNAAVMLQWRFVAPVSTEDTIRDMGLRVEAAEAIDGLVVAAEKIVAKADGADSEQDKVLRSRLKAYIRKVLKTLPRLLLAGNPEPVRVLELETSPNVRELMDEVLAVYAEEYSEAITKGRLIGAKGGSGPDAAMSEAIAGLVYVHDDARETDMAPSLHHSFTQMAAGFFKTAAEIQPDNLPLASRKRLLRLADSLVEDAAT
jgi:hypothetical protein